VAFGFSNRRYSSTSALYETGSLWIPQNIGQLATDPFRKLLGHAVLWYSNIKEHINLKLNAALTAAEHALSPPNPAGPSPDAGSSAPEPSDIVHPVHQDARCGPGMETPETAATQPPPGPDVAQGVDSDAGGGPEEPPDPDVVMEDELPERNPSDAPADPAPTPASTPAPAPPPAPPPLAPWRASRALRERCPACFGLEEWGRSLREWVSLCSRLILAESDFSTAGEMFSSAPTAVSAIGTSGRLGMAPYHTTPRILYLKRRSPKLTITYSKRGSGKAPTTSLASRRRLSMLARSHGMRQMKRSKKQTRSTTTLAASSS
jgi:hypothetical protein